VFVVVRLKPWPVGESSACARANAVMLHDSSFTEDTFSRDAWQSL